MHSRMNAPQCMCEEHAAADMKSRYEPSKEGQKNPIESYAAGWFGSYIKSSRKAKEISLVCL